MRRSIDSRWPKCDGQVKLFSRQTLLRFESGKFSQRNRKWLYSRLLKVYACNRTSGITSDPMLWGSLILQPSGDSCRWTQEYAYIILFLFPSLATALKSGTWMILIFFFMVWQPVVGQGFFVIEPSRSHSDTPHPLGRTPLDERSVRRRDLYLTKHNYHKR